MSSQYLTALTKGETVDPATATAMKKTQLLLNVALAVGALTCSIFPGVAVYLTPAIITNVFAVYTAVNIYLTTASTDKIGLSS